MHERPRRDRQFSKHWVYDRDRKWIGPIDNDNTNDGLLWIYEVNLYRNMCFIVVINCNHFKIKNSDIIEILLIRLRSLIFIIFFVQDWTIKKILFFVLNIQFSIKNSSNNLRSKHTQTNFSFVILKTSSKPQSKTGANLFHINRSSAPFIFCILIYCGRK